MFTLIRGKILNKKSMNLCLLMGIIMFLSIAACTPMFENGSLKKLLQNRFDDYITANNMQPLLLSRNDVIQTNEGINIDNVEKLASEYFNLWSRYIPTNVESTETVIMLPDAPYSREYEEEKGYLVPAYIPDLSSHIEITYGKVAEADIPTCIILEKVMEETGIVVGETITLPNYTNADKDMLRLKVTGSYRIKDYEDSFWLMDTKNLRSMICITKNSFQKICDEYRAQRITYSFNMSLDYKNTDIKDVDRIVHSLNTYIEKDKNFSTNAFVTFNDYVRERKEIKVILIVIELPMLALLLFFLYMVTGQIISTEQSEIAILKCRGYSGFAILRIYIMQAIILVSFGMIFSLPLGYLICLFAASAKGFMTFEAGNFSNYSFCFSMIIYALVAGIVTIIIMNIPVIRYLGGSVVSARNEKMEAMKKSFIRKYYIDVILTIVFSYLVYNYYGQREVLSQKIINGEGIDAVMFLSSSFLILSLSLLCIRLTSYIVGIVYRLGKKRWHPNMYASFLELKRSNKRRDYISIFIIFTVAMSIFHANLAATINETNDKRIKYNIGADIVFSEEWTPLKKMDSKLKKSVFFYEEPDYERFSYFKQKNASMTRVIHDDKVIVMADSHKLDNCSLFAIHTKEFGENALEIGNMNGEHWYNLLNELSKNRDGVLISSPMADSFGIKVGDRITYARENELVGSGESALTYTQATVCGIFDSFPGYEKYLYKYNEDLKTVLKDHNLIVTNYSSEVNIFGYTPYEIWMNTKNCEIDGNSVREFCKENGISLKFCEDVSEEIDQMRSSSKVQITNGLFSLGFIISTMTCMVGMLIYWISSFRRREMLFSIYRAMGMTMKEVMGIILNEQLYSSVTAWIFGGLTGGIISFACTRLLSTVYLPYKHNIALNVSINYSDISKLLVFVLMIIVLCIIIMKRLMKRSNMVMAIKMGED